MTLGNSYRKCLRRHLSGVVVVMLFFAWGGFWDSAGASSADRILHLTPEKDHYFLGSYLDYLEDPEKKFTIEDVTSPQMSPRFVSHEGKMLNLGIDTHACWLRFTVSAANVQHSYRKWLLYLGRPNLIEHATLPPNIPPTMLHWPRK